MSSNKHEENLAKGKQRKELGDAEFKKLNGDVKDGMSTRVFALFKAPRFSVAFWLARTALGHYHRVNASIQPTDSRGGDEFEYSRLVRIPCASSV